MNPGSAPAPTFSVIVPAYNAAETVGDAIRSVLNQTVAGFEVIVVDDGSTDGTSAEIERFAVDPRVRHIRQSNAGLAATRNRALREARGCYATFLDADDLLLPHYLQTMGETLGEAPEAGFAHCDFWVFDEATRQFSAWPLGRLALPGDPNDLMRMLLRRNVLHGGATVRTDVLHEVGYLNASLPACEDLELWLRILAHGYTARRAAGRLSVWRSRGSSLSHQSVLMVSSLCEVYRLVAEEYDVGDDIRALARARMRVELKRLAALTGERRLAATAGRVRRAAGTLRRALLQSRRHRDIPPEVAAAFPELVRRRVEPG
jgi:hypothetical protein